MSAAERAQRYREIQRERSLVTTEPQLPTTSPVLQIRREAHVEPIAYRVSRVGVGVVLIGAGLTLAFTSMRANAWFGYALSIDNSAGGIFATLSVTAELIAFVLPTANRFYRDLGERWASLRGWAMALVASAIVAFAATGFVLTNVSDKTAARRLETFAVDVARRALDDAKLARDRECVRVGPVCRQREDAVVARQRELAETLQWNAGDPQARALGVDPSRLRLVQAVVLVTLCLLAGLVLSHGWGLVFRR